MKGDNWHPDDIVRKADRVMNARGTGRSLLCRLPEAMFPRRPRATNRPTCISQPYMKNGALEVRVIFYDKRR